MVVARGLGTVPADSRDSKSESRTSFTLRVYVQLMPGAVGRIRVAADRVLASGGAGTTVVLIPV